MVLLYPDHPISNEHKLIEKSVVLRPSSITGAGNGVYTLKDINRGDDLGYYIGEVLTENEFENRYAKDGYGEYVLRIPDKNAEGKFIIIDAKNHYNWVSRVNAPKGTKKRKNIYWDNEGRVYASRNIKAGEELFVDYGNDYWKGKKRGETRKNKKDLRRF